MNVMSLSHKPSPMASLPDEIQIEINASLRAVDKRALELGLEERGAIRAWLLSGTMPNPVVPTPLALAVRDAPQPEWDALVENRHRAGMPLAGTISSGGKFSKRAGHEQKVKWQSVMRLARERMPSGADLENWVGLLPLAERMIELEASQ